MTVTSKPNITTFLDNLASLPAQELKKHPIVVFHHDDADGAFAAASVLYGLQNPITSMDIRDKSISATDIYGLIENITFVNINYDRQDDKTVVQNVPVGASVFVLDFAFTHEVNEVLIGRSSFFLTLDHHKSSALRLGNTEHLYFDMESSGALMAFNYFNPKHTTVPLCITLADNRDLWKKTHGGEDAFHEVIMNLRSLNNNRTFIEKLVGYFDDYTTNRFIVKGKDMLEKRDANIRSVTAKKRLIHTTLGGYPAVLFNYGIDQSDACAYLYNKEEYQDHIVGAYSFLANGTVNFSLRKGKLCKADLSVIAEVNYAGGGHAQAAGFHVDYERAINILQSKEKWAMCWKTSEVNGVEGGEFKKELLQLSAMMVSRSVCETDESFQQVLPYIILRDRQTGNIARYFRPKTSGEARLHGDMSIGFGGHIDTLPTGLNMAVHLADEAMRELQEEVGLIDNGYTANIYKAFQEGNFFVLRDLSNEVGKVHLGLAVLLDVDVKDIQATQVSEIEGFEWFAADHFVYDINNSRIPVENWSKKLIDGWHIVDRKTFPWLTKP